MNRLVTDEEERLVEREELALIRLRHVAWRLRTVTDGYAQLNRRGRARLHYLTLHYLTLHYLSLTLSEHRIDFAESCG